MARALTSQHRLNNIALARQQVLEHGSDNATPLVDEWIQRSWRRCMSWGQQPQHGVHFETVSQAHSRRLQEQHQPLLRAAQAELDRLSRAISGTRYFALLTNAQGVVIDTRGAIDAHDARANNLARVGVNLSEQSVGTTAIGAALAEHRPIWLHRGEHFFNDNNAYSCAGAPLFSPQGDCIGMLDLTGIDVPERPELKHLAAQSARSIENALIQQHAPALLLHINWAGQLLGNDNDGLIGLDADGFVICANRQARQIMGLSAHAQPHAGDVFACAWQSLFDATQKNRSLELPLWSGLRIQVQTGQTHQPLAVTPTAPALKAAESDLIRRAMQQAHGNVTEAARHLGISRATLYRKISQAKTTR
ncbi:helix-turn-helix domain-containing protein [Limnohabitans sp.]|uniref:helix-turn-helix domain-containing protein n=1 Tax=Limnohabitans sp. TaxID=1907725 RepID=UPI00334226AC